MSIASAASQPWERPLPPTTSSQTLLKKSSPGMLLALQQLPWACHQKVISCLNRKVALERAGGLLTQPPELDTREE